jgi:predicted phosphohydrolase
MSRIIWLTDLHLNFLAYPQMLGAYVRTDLSIQDGDVILITGDISEGPRLVEDLKLLQEGFKVPVYYVLGNHDYYNGSFASVAKSLSRKGIKKTTWLRHNRVWVSKDTILLGHDGWYDGRAGKSLRSNVGMSDWELIQDIRPYMNRPVDRLEFLRKTADAWSEEARASLEEVCAMGPKRVLFATHIPPFPEAAWHKGGPSDPNWLPWVTNVALGRVLADVAEDHKTIRFEVYCGHTHSPGHCRPCSNLQVFTGEAEYGNPQVSGIIDL